MRSILCIAMVASLLAGPLARAASPLAGFSGNYKGTGQVSLVIEGAGVVADVYSGKFWATVVGKKKGSISLDGVLADSDGTLLGFSTGYGIAGTKLSYKYGLLGLASSTKLGRVKVSGSAITYSATIVLDSQPVVVSGTIRKIGKNLSIREQFTYQSLQEDSSRVPLTMSTQVTLKPL